MVDISGKTETSRRAVASSFVKMNSDTLTAIRDEKVPKGDVFAAARIAGILGAKRVAELIPLCHPLNIDFCEITFEMKESGISVRSEVKVRGTTGAEMEAMTAVSIAALTVYDMCKSMDKGIVIADTMLLEKDGGKSGSFRRE